MKSSKFITAIASIAIAVTGAFAVSQQTAKAEAGHVGTVRYGLAPLYREDYGGMSNRALADGSAWALGRLVKNSQGQLFYQVSTYEYVDAARLIMNKLPEKVTYIANFGLPGYTSANEYDANNNTHTVDANNIDASGNNINTGSTNTGNTGNTNNNAGNTGNSSSQSDVPDTAAVQQAILQSINNERASKGISPLALDDQMNQTAMVRAKEISTVFSHTRPNGESTYTAFPSNRKGSSEENIYMCSVNMINGSAEKLAEQIMDTFRKETGPSNHYTNLMSSSVNLLGLGVYYNPENKCIYIAQDFIGGY